ncbi:MAG: FG-GAP-like repeat-containing protein [Planctomycetota bacterium]|nr:FG-GAP-like repeat-containing protein [Planctomycetota bacterium]
MRRLAGLLFVLAAVLAAGCGDKPTPPQPPGVTPPTGPPVLARAPTFQLTDQDGAPFGTTDLLGEVWIANFMFTRCGATCPIQTARLSVLQGQLAQHPRRGDIRIVSISVDSDYDTPEVLAAYASAHGASTDRWRFLTGVRRDIWLLSTEGFRLPAGPDPSNEAMPIGHSSRLVVVDRRGRIRAFVDSQPADSVDQVMAVLEPLVAEPTPARVAKPPEVLDPPWLPQRAAVQVEKAAAWSVEHGFQFRDARYASGIRFRHRMVDDAGRNYKAVHYDHGNGLAAADVDGDGLLDLYFCNQVGSNRLYRGLGGGRFEDITKEAGVAVSDAIGVSASFADTDNDGDPDLYVTTVRGGNRFFVNDGKGRFTDATASSGLAYSGHSSAAVFFDFNRDGRLDLFVCNVGTYTSDRRLPVVDDSTTAGSEAGSYEYFEGLGDGFSGHLKTERDEVSRLYRNLGENRFQDVTAPMFIGDVSWTGAATPIDGNDDGWPDLYVLDMQGHDEYYENQKGASFRKLSREVFPRTPWGTMGAKVFDQDGDGLLDLYVTDMHSDMCETVSWLEEKDKSNMRWPETILRSEGKSIYGNALYRKAGPGRYDEVSDKVGAETFWPWGLSVGDLNADGHLDVFVTGGMSYPFRYGINSVLLNDAGRGFLDAEFVLGVEPRSGPLATPWFDLACGEGTDAEHGDCKGRDGPTVMWSAASSRSSLIVDLDDDGDLDIVTNDFNTEPLVLLSDLADKKPIHWLKVVLRGKEANRDGLGAIVKVYAGDQVFVQVHDGQTGYLSQGLVPLYFGLGAHTQVKRVEVQWLGGSTQVLDEPGASNRTLVIHQAP